MAKRNLNLGTADGLLEPPHDLYWDAPMTRREAQEAVNQLAANDQNLAAQNDTTNIVMNFLCERLNVKREEIDSWVAKKKELVAMVKAGVLKPDDEGNLTAATQENNVPQPTNS